MSGELITMDRATFERIRGEVIDSINGLSSAFHYHRVLMKSVHNASQCVEEETIDELVTLLWLVEEKVELEPVLNALRQTHRVLNLILAATRNDVESC